MHTYTLDRDEKKVKNLWLLVYLIIAFGLPLLLILVFFISEIRNDIIAEKVAVAISNLIFDAIFFPIFYICAYRKPGTALITYCLYVIPICFFYKTFMKFEPISNNIELLFTLLLIGLQVWWYILTLKLRKVNKKIQFKIVSSTDAYSQAVSNLESTGTLDELKTAFREIVHRNPDLSFFLKQVYKKQKMRLTSPD